jgi:hypothetical protein
MPCFVVTRLTPLRQRCLKTGLFENCRSSKSHSNGDFFSVFGKNWAVVSNVYWFPGYPRNLLSCTGLCSLRTWSRKHSLRCGLPFETATCLPDRSSGCLTLCLSVCLYSHMKQTMKRRRNFMKLNTGKFYSNSSRHVKLYSDRRLLRTSAIIQKLTRVSACILSKTR